MPSTASLDDIRIRPATPADAQDLATLVAELGYPTNSAAAATRLSDLTAAGDAVLVAERQGRVVGLVMLHRTHFLHRPPDGRIVTLVVTQACRSQGVGHLLLTAAEQLLRQWGCGRVEVSSGAQREAAHRFYLRAGYVEQPKRFVKLVLN
jgi:GNAT superfamily N-acetyltransferase